MSRQIIFRRDHFIVVRSFSSKGMYYTIVNTKRGKHSHVYKEELTAAIMICKCAQRDMIPEDYPNWMQESIRRIKDDDRPSTKHGKAQRIKLGRRDLNPGSWQTSIRQED